MENLHDTRVAVIRSILGAWETEGPDEQAKMVAAYMSAVIAERESAKATKEPEAA